MADHALWWFDMRGSVSLINGWVDNLGTTGRLLGAVRYCCTGGISRADPAPLYHRGGRGGG